MNEPRNYDIMLLIIILNLIITYYCAATYLFELN